MPSGAKKRKQAKKRKEQQAHSNTYYSSAISDAHSHGNDDPKSQDERDSDGDELGSPASQDHQNHRHPFNEENEEYEKSVQSSFAAEGNPIDGVERNMEGRQNTSVRIETVVETQREVNLQQDTGSIDVNVEATHNGDDKSSSSSSSDEESRAFDEKRKVESHYSLPDAISCGNVEKIEEVKEDSTFGKQVTKANGNSVMEIVPAMDWVTPVVPMTKHLTEGAQSENVEVSVVVESEFRENEDTLLPTCDVVDSLVPEENEEKVFSILNQNVGASTTVSASNINGNEDKFPKSSSSQTRCAENINDFEASDGTVIKNEVETLVSSVAHTSEDIKKAKNFEASENIETQPLVPPAPRIAQRTSVLSCCGLFDVFARSNR